MLSRMSNAAVQAYLNLPAGAQKDVAEYMHTNDREELSSPRDVVDAYLVWNGIIGFTDQIVSVVRAAYGNNDETTK